jgi:two-component system chemotaxis sensor kinase CheA
MAKDPYRYFRVEARDLLEGLTAGILQLEKGTAAPDVVGRLLRLAHTLKGAARVVKQREAGRPLSRASSTRGNSCKPFEV